MEWLDEQALGQVDFVRIRFILEFEADFVLGPEALLQLRRELKNAGEMLTQTGPAAWSELAATLLRPRANPDPVSRRAFPFFPPPFALQPPACFPVCIGAGDNFPLEVVFWGEGRQLIGAFTKLLLGAGERGLYCGQGPFALSAVEALTPGGLWTLLWQGSQFDLLPELPILRGADWVEAWSWPDRIQFRTPARLLVRRKPLYAPSPGRVLPFFLRRVTAMCTAWCGVDLVPDPGQLLSCFGRGQEPCTDLSWQDWRSLERSYGSQDLGGLVGEMDLPEDWRMELHPLFALASLLNLGKGAAYGAGAW